MRDLNFFEPYLEKRDFKFNKFYVLYGILILSIICITVFGVYNEFKIKSLEADIVTRKDIVEDPTTVNKVNEIKELETEVNTFSLVVNNMIQLDSSIEGNNLISEELLKRLKSNMPEDLFLSNLSAFDREIQISGVSKDTYSIAEFSKGLELMEESESVFVSNITNTDVYYNFVLNLTLKDVNMVGNESN